MENEKILSICVPVYNRSEDVRKLFDSIGVESKVEVVICDDGSTDNLISVLKEYSGKIDFKYIYQENSGVSKAIETCYQNAQGHYVIKMDSDDEFLPNGLNIILSRIKEYKDSFKCLVFGTVEIENGIVEGNIPPLIEANFINLRFDYGIKGDLKEVVTKELVLSNMYNVPKGVRRIPPSLLWTTIAEKHNCMAIDEAVAKKSYLEGGISKNILKIKSTYSQPMTELYEKLATSNRYKSQISRWRNRILLGRYTLHNGNMKLNRWWEFLVFPLSVFIYLKDLLTLFLKEKL